MAFYDMITQYEKEKGSDGVSSVSDGTPSFIQRSIMT